MGLDPGPVGGVDSAIGAYPISYEQSPPERRSRLSVFFRFLLMIPLLVWTCVYGIAFYVVVVVAWFAILVTGRWPAGMYGFAAGFIRFIGRVEAYFNVIVDAYPPFDGGEHPEYPVRIGVAPPKERYSRLRVLFRIVLAIPVYILQYLFSLWLLAVAIVIWLVAVVTGRTPAALSGAMLLPMAYYVRACAFFSLVVEEWPPFDPTA